MQEENLSGTLFDGRFKVESVLGRGGMGSVYLVEHEVLQRRFALKVLHSELVLEPNLAQMFQREARAASRVQHPNVTFVFDYSQTDGGQPYIVMEYVKGVTLGEALKEAKVAGEAFPLGRTLDILAQIADGLNAAHACGVVHRDLKPANVALTTRRGRADFVKVLDFGLAKLARGTSTLNNTDQRAIFGTPEYMSPEQGLEDEALVDHRSDLYGLGIMAYEILAGEPPFVGQPLHVLWCHQENEPKSIKRQLAGKRQIAPALDELVMACLRKKPADRPQTATEVAAALRSIAQGIPNIAGQVGGADLGASTFFGVSSSYVIASTAPGLTGPQPQMSLVPKTVVTPVGALACTDHLNRDPQSHALEDLVMRLRGLGLGSENTVHLLSRMLELDDEVAGYEQEFDLLQGQIVHLEMRVAERSARLREALIQLEHEITRQRDRVEQVGEQEVNHQVERLQDRAAEIAVRMRHMEDGFDERLEELEIHQRAIQPIAEQHRQDAQRLRDILLMQLRTIRRQEGVVQEEIIAMFVTAGI